MEEGIRVGRQQHSRIASSDYRTVHALLDPKRIAHKLTVNGIVVIEADRHYSPWKWFTDYETKLDRWERILRDGVGGTFGLRVPQFSIFDPDGNLPLNLQRTELTQSHLDFMAGAFEAQTKAALALILISVPEIPTLSDAFVTTIRSMFRDVEILPVFFTQFGAGLVTQKNLQGANVKNCLMVSVEQRHNPRLCKLQCRYDATIFFKEFDPEDFAHGDHAPDPLDSVPGTILNVREIGLSGYHSDRGDHESFESGLIEFATANCPSQ